MAKQIQHHGAVREPRFRKHSQEQIFTGKSRTATRSNVVRLRASGRGTPNTVNGKAPPRDEYRTRQDGRAST